MYRRILVASLLASADASAQEPFGPRPGVTVTVFEFGAVATHAAAAARPQRYPGPYAYPDAEAGSRFLTAVGTGVSDLVVEQLIASERFRVYERRQLEAVRREQHIEANYQDRIERARYVITGSISLLGNDDKDIGGMVAGAASDALGLGRGLSALFTNTSRTTMRVTVRVVDSQSGEVIGSFTSEGHSRKRWDASFLSMGAGGTKGGSLGSKNFRETAIGEAGHRAATDIAERIIAMRAQRLRP